MVDIKQIGQRTHPYRAKLVLAYIQGLQAIVVQAKSVTGQNDSNQDFANWQFTGAGFADEDVYTQAVDYGKVLGDYKVQEEGNMDNAKTPKAESDEY